MMGFSQCMLNKRIIKELQIFYNADTGGEDRHAIALLFYYVLLDLRAFLSEALVNL